MTATERTEWRRNIHARHLREQREADAAPRRPAQRGQEGAERGRWGSLGGRSGCECHHEHERAGERAMSTCRRCGDLKRQYGWACDDLRNAARKLVSSGGDEKFAERVRDAKFRKAEIATALNAHAAEHSEGEVA